MAQWNLLFVFSRVLIAQIFVISGLRKLLGYAGAVGYFKMLGMPLPGVLVPLTIAVELGGGLALAFGVKLRPVAIVLALFTLFSALIGHQFWAAEGAQFGAQLNNFLKNVAMVGGFVGLIIVEAQRREQAGQFA